MRKYLFQLGIPIITFILFALASKAEQSIGDGKALSIEGTYVFVSRDFAEGSAVKSLDVKGLMTFTKKYRNFNLTWKTPDGKHFSVSYICEYTLNSDAYQETPIYWMLYDETQGAPDYAVPGDKAKPSAVAAQDGKISFKLNGENISLTFEGNSLTAVSSEGFIDHWEKVG